MKSVGFDKLGEVHAAYLKGMRGPHAVVTREHDASVRQSFAGKPISRRAYNAKVEAFAGRCRCGGSFTLRASARCPRCRSKSFKEDPDGDFACYD
jgi:hypothetical protein